jgi:hypothetical protein
MSRLVSITVVVQDDAGNPQTFEVDTANQNLLVWGTGWGVLEEYYDKAKGEKHKGRMVKDRACPRAKPKVNAKPRQVLALLAEAAADSADPVIALKDDGCNPTQWP